MFGTAKLLTPVFIIGSLSVISAAALAGSLDTPPVEPTALRTLFHDAEFNVPDDLNTYAEDLSAYGTPRQAGSASQLLPGEVTSMNGTAAPELDLVALRALFHNAEFNVPDDLNTYTEDLSDVAINRRSTVAQLPK